MSDLEDEDEDNHKRGHEEVDLAELEDELENEEVKAKSKQDNKKNIQPQKEEDKKTEKKKNEVVEVDSPKKTKNDEQPKQEIKVETKQEIIHTDKSNGDVYNEKVEQMYHRPDKMKSIGVLQEELKIVDDIIKYKTDKGLDYDFFESKKDMIDIEIQKIENLCECGAMDLETYKKLIESQLKYEDQILSLTSQDKVITPEMLTVIIQRINKRKELITAELTQEVEEEEPVEETENKEEVTEEKKVNKEEVKEVTEENKEIKEENDDKQNTGDVKMNNVESKTSDTKVSEPKPVEINKPLYDSLKSRFMEYKEAMDYFRKIGSAKQEEDAISKAKLIARAVKDVEEGKEVDEFSLPINVTPDFICGYSKQERLNHFSNIIKEFSARKNDLNAQLQTRMDKLKTLDKKDFMKIVNNLCNIYIERRSKKGFR